MRLINQHTGCTMPIIARMKSRGGMFVVPQRGIGLFLMNDEIYHVAELPPVIREEQTA